VPSEGARRGQARGALMTDFALRGFELRSSRGRSGPPVGVRTPFSMREHHCVARAAARKAVLYSAALCCMSLRDSRGSCSWNRACDDSRASSMRDACIHSKQYCNRRVSSYDNTHDLTSSA
jgi:hypothetical protein